MWGAWRAPGSAAHLSQIFQLVRSNIRSRSFECARNARLASWAHSWVCRPFSQQILFLPWPFQATFWVFRSAARGFVRRCDGHSCQFGWLVPLRKLGHSPSWYLLKRAVSHSNLVKARARVWVYRSDCWPLQAHSFLVPTWRELWTDSEHFDWFLCLFPRSTCSLSPLDRLSTYAAQRFL